MKPYSVTITVNGDISVPVTASCSEEAGEWASEYILCAEAGDLSVEYSKVRSIVRRRGKYDVYILVYGTMHMKVCADNIVKATELAEAKARNADFGGLDIRCSGYRIEVHETL